MPTISKANVELNNVVNPMADSSIVGGGGTIGGGNIDEDSGFQESLYHVKEDVANAILDPRAALKNAMKKEVPLGVNSKHRTIFLMLNTMIGSGILNQPQVFAHSGIFGAFILFILCGYFIWLGCVIILDVGLRLKVDSFQELMEKRFGKAGKVFLDLLIIIGNIGALMSYLTIIGGTLTSLINSWGGGGEGDNVYLITVLVTTFLVLPLCLNRHFGHLGVISYISIGAIIIVLLVVIIAGPIFGNGGRIVMINGTGMFSKLGSIVFALSCIPASFHAYSGVKDTSLPLWKEIMRDSVGYGIVMCVVMGLAGYLSFRDNTSGMILDNFTTHFGDPFDLMLCLHLIL
jgi:solute carrier family 38 (sodium-coupled neutral amino acid transporter), member 11